MAKRSKIQPTPVVRRELTAAEYKERVIERLQSDLKFAQRNIDEFIADLQRNPAYAMEWADGRYDYAAKIGCAKYLLTWAEEHPETFTGEEVLRYATDQAMRAARYPSKSTSSSANRMHAEYGSVWAEYAEKFGALAAWAATEAKEKGATAGEATA